MRTVRGRRKQPIQRREHVPIFAGTADLDIADPGLGTQHHFGHTHGAKRKWTRHRLSLPLTSEPHGQLLGAGAPLVGSGEGRCKFGMENLTYP